MRPLDKSWVTPSQAQTNAQALAEKQAIEARLTALEQKIRELAAEIEELKAAKERR